VQKTVAGTITWERLRELAAFRARKGCAVSVYVNLDPGEVPTAREAAIRLNSVLAGAERQLAERRPGLTHEEREALKADLARIEAWFDHDFDRDGSHGVAVFAAGLDNLWSSLPLPGGVADGVQIDVQLYVTPLVRLVGDGAGALVAYVGRERGQVFRLLDGRLVELVDDTTDVPGRHDQGGWSQARYERHIEEIVGRHLREVVADLERWVRRLEDVRLVLVGPEEVRSEFEALLSQEVLSRLVGWTTAESHADANRLLEVAQPLLQRSRSEELERLLGRWREEAAKSGRAAAGWEETLEAASDGRVDLLLVQDGVDRPAYRCPACGRAQMTNGKCPLDGTTMECCAGGLDLAVHQTLNHGGTVRVLRESRDLEPVGGVAALLRF
jgi:peptide chain release factor subunit 1